MDTDRNNGRGVPAQWANWVNLGIGVWMILAPFLLGYADLIPALWNDIVVGALIAAAAFLATRSYSPGASWFNVAFGAWLVVAPFLLNYMTYGFFQQAVGNDIIAGLAVVALGLVAGLAKVPATRARATGR